MSSIHMSRRFAAQRGFTLVELMVALTIGLVLVLGFAVSFVGLKTAFQSQDKLSQLQDNERLAMSFLTSSVQEAGYFPQPTPPNPDRAAGIPNEALSNQTDIANFGATVAGQFILGMAAPDGTKSDSLSTLYTSAGSVSGGTNVNDGLLTCQGGLNTTGANAVFRNIFYVDKTQNALGCIAYVNGNTAAPGNTFQVLVSNVSNMSLMYAVDTNSDGIADTYMTAAQVAAASLWNNVKSVRVTLTLINPNAAATGQNAYINWVQNINLMNNR